MSLIETQVTPLLYESLLDMRTNDDAFHTFIEKCEQQFNDVTLIRGNTQHFNRLYPLDKNSLPNLPVLTVWLPDATWDGEDWFDPELVHKLPSVKNVLSTNLQRCASLFTWEFHNKLYCFEIGNAWPEFRKSNFSSMILLGVAPSLVCAARLDLKEDFWSSFDRVILEKEEFDKSPQDSKIRDYFAAANPSIKELQQVYEFNLMSRADFNL